MTRSISMDEEPPGCIMGRPYNSPLLESSKKAFTVMSGRSSARSPEYILRKNQPRKVQRRSIEQMKNLLSFLLIVC